jgi:hypothetical protein
MAGECLGRARQRWDSFVPPLSNPAQGGAAAFPWQRTAVRKILPASPGPERQAAAPDIHAGIAGTVGPDLVRPEVAWASCP